MLGYDVRDVAVFLPLLAEGVGELPADICTVAGDLPAEVLMALLSFLLDFNSIIAKQRIVGY